MKNLEIANTVCKGGMSLYTAATIFSVPESTHRDRTREKISVDAHVGYSTILTPDEERALVEHIKYMGDIDYEYNKVVMQSLTRDYAVTIGKRFRVIV